MLTIPVQYSTATPISFLRPALNAVRETNFVEVKKESESHVPGISDKMLLDILRSIRESLKEIRALVMKMTKEEAKAWLNEFTPEEYKILNDREKTYKLSFGKSEIENEMISVAKYLVSIYDDLQVVVEAEPVDEESPEFKNFMDAMILEATKTPIIYSEKALMELFND